MLGLGLLALLLGAVGWGAQAHAKKQEDKRRRRSALPSRPTPPVPPVLPPPPPYVPPPQGRLPARVIPPEPPPLPPEVIREQKRPLTKREKALTRGMTPEVIRLAKFYGERRGLPVAWILTTIGVESRGKPGAIGDGGKSYGLMQVNWVAHDRLLRQLGLTKDDLFTPEVNIAVGTYLMRQFLNRILKELDGRPAPAPLDEILRLAYKGPAYVYKSLRQGRDPRKVYSWAPPAVANWRETRAAVEALV